MEGHLRKSEASCINAKVSFRTGMVIYNNPSKTIEIQEFHTTIPLNFSLFTYTIDKRDE